jgi:hypothetical protein
LQISWNIRTNKLEGVMMEKAEIYETYYHPVEIIIPAADTKVKVEQALPMDWEKVAGVVVVNPGGTHNGGLLKLSIGGEEIFPEKFHARCFMQTLSSHHNDPVVVKSLDRYMYEFEENAEGATVSATYTEPPQSAGGTKGILYLYLKLKRKHK